MNLLIDFLDAQDVAFDKAALNRADPTGQRSPQCDEVLVRHNGIVIRSLSGNFIREGRCSLLDSAGGMDGLVPTRRTSQFNFKIVDRRLLWEQSESA